MRALLDRLYAGALGVSALCFVAIAVMVLIQIIGRLLDRTILALGGEPLGLQVPSLAELGAFLFAVAAVLGLAGTLRAGAHVRVTMLPNALPSRAQRGLNVLVLLCGDALAAFATWYNGLQAWDSYSFGSLSYGIVKVPLWLPQGAITLGFGLLLIALIDELWAELSGTGAAFRAAERSTQISEG